MSTHAALVSFPLSSLCRSIKLSCERRELMAAKRMQVSSCRTVLRRSCPGSSAASGRERTVRHLALQQNKPPRIVSCRAPPAPDLRPADPLDSAGTHTRAYVVTHTQHTMRPRDTRSFLDLPNRNMVDTSQVVRTFKQFDTYRQRHAHKRTASLPRDHARAGIIASGGQQVAAGLDGSTHSRCPSSVGRWQSRQSSCPASGRSPCTNSHSPGRREACMQPGATTRPQPVSASSVDACPGGRQADTAGVQHRAASHC